MLKLCAPILLGLLITSPVLSQEQYPPFFKDEPVQKCALEVAPILVEGTEYKSTDLINEASKYNRLLPEMTKASDRDMAVMQIKVITNIWVEGRKNLRPGFSFSLHELGQGLLRICTYSVFEGIDPADILHLN